MIDLSKYSDEELEKMLGGISVAPRTPIEPVDVSGVPDQELEKIAALGTEPASSSIDAQAGTIPGKSIFGDQQPASSVPKDPDRGIVTEALTAVPRGIAAGVGTVAEAVRHGQTPEEAPKSTAVSEWVKGLSDKYEFMRPSEKPGIVKTAGEAVESVAQSLTAGAGGIAAGAVAGTATGVPVAGTIVGGALGAGGVFGAAKYDQVMQDARKQGLIEKLNKQGVDGEKLVRDTALYTGLIEGGVETAADLALARLSRLMPGTQAAKAGLKETLRQIFKTPLKEIGKSALKGAAVEGGTEALQSGWEANLEQGIGLKREDSAGNLHEIDPMGEATGSIVPGGAAGVLFSLLGQGASGLQKRNMIKRLYDEKGNAKDRVAAAVDTAKILSSEHANPLVAKNWLNTAVQDIQAGKSVSVDELLSGYDYMIPGTPSTTQDEQPVSAVPNMDFLQEPTHQTTPKNDRLDVFDPSISDETRRNQDFSKAISGFAPPSQPGPADTPGADLNLFTLQPTDRGMKALKDTTAAWRRDASQGYPPSAVPQGIEIPPVDMTAQDILNQQMQPQGKMEEPVSAVPGTLMEGEVPVRDFTPETSAPKIEPDQNLPKETAKAVLKQLPEIDQKAHGAATSPISSVPQPTAAQKEAGNYAKGHVSVQGLDISIENPKGSIRSGKDKSGKPWQQQMANHYGYIKGTVGKDKDHIDTFIGADPESDQVYVIDQIDPKTGKFDEHKVVLGTYSPEEAWNAYHDNYEKNWKGAGSMTAMSMPEFKEWLKSGKTKQALSYKEKRKEVPAAIVTGKEVTAKTERGTAVKARYEVVDAKDLVTSHDSLLKENPDYPQELQPRDRGRAVSEMQISGIMNRLEPDFLGESPKASEGAPIIGDDNVVESGNGRAIALRRLYEQGHANGQKYRNWLLENAEKFGLNRSKIEQAKSPVLVRRRTGEIDREAFVKEANEQSVAAMSASEQAVSDAQRMDDAMMSEFFPGEDGNLLTVANREFVKHFMRTVVSPAEAARYLTASGSVSQEGITRMRNAIFAKAYGETEVLEKLAESTDSNVKNITNAMLLAAPDFVKLERDIQRGDRYNLNIAQDVSAAVRKVSDLRDKGDSIAGYLGQVEIAPEISDLAKEILSTIDKYKRSAQKIASVFRVYIDQVDKVGSPQQQDIFGSTEIPSAASLFDLAVEVSEAANGQIYKDRSGVGGEGGQVAESQVRYSRKEPESAVPGQVREKQAVFGPDDFKLTSPSAETGKPRFQHVPREQSKLDLGLTPADMRKPDPARLDTTMAASPLEKAAQKQPSSAVTSAVPSTIEPPASSAKGAGSQPETVFAKGQEVQMKVRTGKDSFTWEPAKIEDVLNGGETYEVSFENKARPGLFSTIRLNKSQIRSADSFDLESAVPKEVRKKPEQPGFDMGTKGSDLRAPEHENKPVTMDELPLGKATNEAADREKQGDIFSQPAAQQKSEPSSPSKDRLQKMIESQGTTFVDLSDDPDITEQLVHFTDPKTGSTLSMPIKGITVPAIKAKIEASRETFAAQKKPLNMAGQTMPEKAKPAEAPEFTSLHPKSQEKFNTSWETKDRQGMQELLYHENKGLRAEFEKRSGLKLPKTIIGTNGAIKGWAEGKEEVKAEQKNFFIPLMTEYYEKIKSGEQDSEIRPLNRGAWNTKNIHEGRKVTFSKGYGTQDRVEKTIERTVTTDDLAKAGVPQWHIDAVEKIYGKQKEWLIAFVKPETGGKTEPTAVPDTAQVSPKPAALPSVGTVTPSSEKAGAVKEKTHVPTEVQGDREAPATPAQPVITKEPWQMTREEYRADERRKKYDAIVEALKSGKTVNVQTAYRVTPISSPDHIRLAKSGGVQTAEGRGKWVNLVDAQVDHLAAQAGMKLPKADERAYHEDIVDRAVKDGKPVPAEVLAEYPKLSGKGEASSDIRYSKKQIDAYKNLLTVHNLSQENLRHVLKQGGMAVPSLAVIDAEKSNFTIFGDITLIAKKEQFAPEASRENKFFDADVYSPRYPTIKTFLSKKSRDRLQERLIEAEKSIPQNPEKNGARPFYPYGVAEEINDKGLEALKRDPLVELIYLQETNQVPKGVDTSWEGKEKVRKAVDKAGREKFEVWVDTEFTKQVGIETTEKIFKGFTYSGRRSYLPHNLDTVVKLLKKELRDGEGFNYGAGSVRSTVAKQFRTLKSIQNDRGRIVSSELMKQAKEEANQELIALADTYKSRLQEPRGDRFGWYDTFSEHIKEGAETRNFRKTFDQYYDEGTDLQPVQDFLEKLKNMPTEYFEGKIQRGVSLSEFDTAVVPEGMPKDLMDGLRDKGLNIVTYKKNDNADRKAKLQSVTKARDLRYSKKRPAPVFYSQLEKTVGQSLPDSVKSEGLLSFLKRFKFKQDDLIHSGIAQVDEKGNISLDPEVTAMEKNGKIAKSDIMAFIGEKSAKIVPVEFGETLEGHDAPVKDVAREAFDDEWNSGKWNDWMYESNKIEAGNAWENTEHPAWNNLNKTKDQYIQEATDEDGDVDEDAVREAFDEDFFKLDLDEMYSPDEYENLREEAWNGASRDYIEKVEESRNEERRYRELDKEDVNLTKFAQWKIPGESIPGSYVEHFETVPEINDTGQEIRILSSEFHKLQDAGKKEEASSKYQEYLKKVDEKKNNPQRSWKDGHAPYDSVKNPIVRWRGDGRTSADGVKVFFIHEIQAPNPENQSKMPKWAQKRWREIGLKSALRYAADNGYEKLALATGEQVAGLYDLSKQVDEIRYTHATNKSEYAISVKKIGEDRYEGIGVFPPEKLPDVVGKEVATKILEGKGEASAEEGEEGTYTLSGLDLKVGGSGIRKLYDRDLPSILSNLGQKWGTKVSDIKIVDDHARTTPTGNKLDALTETVRGIDIADTMRESVITQGQPLFKRAEGTKGVVTLSDVQYEIEKLKINNIGLDKSRIKVVMEERFLPARVAKNIKSRNFSGEIEGVLHEGTVYIVSRNLSSPERVQHVIRHELTHRGIRTILGDSIDPMFEQIGRQYRNDVEMIAKEYGLDMNKKDDRLVAVDEFIAQKGENLLNERNIIQRVIFKVRQALRKAGFTIDFSDQDILSMAGAALKAEGMGEGIAYSLKNKYNPPMTPKEGAGDIPTGKPESKPEGGNKELWQMTQDEYVNHESTIPPAPNDLKPGERLWLRYGNVPVSGKSKHLQHGYEEVGVSVMAPLDDLGNTSWSPNMLFSATAGDLQKDNLIVVAGKEIARGSDGEPLISNARFIRKAHSLEKHQLVKDMEDVATNVYNFRKIENLYSLLEAENPNYQKKHEVIVRKAVAEGKPVPQNILNEYGIKSSDTPRSPKEGDQDAPSEIRYSLKPDQLDMFGARRYNSNNEAVSDTGRENLHPGSSAGPEVISKIARSEASSISRVKTAADAGHVVQYLNRYPQERLAVILTTKDGDVVTIHEHSMGGIAVSIVDPKLIVGQALNTPGVEKIWLAHQHPSGLTYPSDEDKAFSKAVANLAKDSGVEMAGSIAVGPGKYTETWNENPNAGFEHGTIEPLTGVTTEIPVVERVWKNFGAQASDRATITPGNVRYYASRHIPEGGIILLGIKSDVLATMPLPTKDWSKIRGIAQNKILREIEKRNASQMIVYEPTRNMGHEEIGNIAGFAKQANIDLGDVIDGSMKSAVDRNLMFPAYGNKPFYSRAENKIVAMIIQNFGANVRIPSVQNKLQVMVKDGIIKKDDVRELSGWLTAQTRVVVPKQEILDRLVKERGDEKAAQEETAPRKNARVPAYNIHDQKRAGDEVSRLRQTISSDDRLNAQEKRRISQMVPVETITPEQDRIAQLVSKFTGKPIFWVKNAFFEGVTIDNNKIFIDASTSLPEDVYRVLVHEFGHVIELSGTTNEIIGREYERFISDIKAVITPEQIKTYLATRHIAVDDIEGAWKEYGSDILADVMRERTFFERLYERSPESFQRLVDWFLDALKQMGLVSRAVQPSAYYTPEQAHTLINSSTRLVHTYLQEMDKANRAQGESVSLKDAEYIDGEFKRPGYSFSGKKAKGFDESAGKFSDLGDRQERFEIDDSGAKLKNHIIDKIANSSSGLWLGQILDHPVLYEQYPSAKNIKVILADPYNDSRSVGASYDTSTDTITINSDMPYKEHLPNILHEIQHAIQQREGFARGASSDAIMVKLAMERGEIEEQIDRINEKLSAAVKNPAEYSALLDERSILVKRYQGLADEHGMVKGKAHDLYRRTAGEEEARRVSARASMTAGERMGTPYDRTDLEPGEERIVRREGGVAEALEKITDTPAFRKWFGQSVVTVDGKPGSEPLAVYHGTDAKFSAFEGRIAGTAGYFTDNKAHAEMYGKKLKEVYLSMNNPLDLYDLDERNNYPENTMRLSDWKRELTARGVSGIKFDSSLNPKETYSFWNLVDPHDANLNSNLIDRIKEAGYDGLVHAEGAISIIPDRVFVPFEPTQIKSATGNTGAFSPENPDIRYSTGRESEDIKNELEYTVVGSDTEDIKALQRAYEQGTGGRTGEALFKEVSVSVRSNVGRNAEAIAKAFGKKVVFFEAPEGIHFDGAIVKEQPGTIFLNVRNKDPHLLTIGHELFHSMKRLHPDLYNEFLENIQGIMKNIPEYRGRLNRARAELGVVPANKELVQEELLSDFIGEQFLKEDFWNELHAQNPTIFERVIQAVKSLLDKIVSAVKDPDVIGSRFFRDIRQARKLAADVMAKYAIKEQGDAIRYSRKPRGAKVASAATENLTPYSAKPERNLFAEIASNPGQFAEIYRKAFQDDDLTKFERLAGLPHWIAKKFSDFDRVMDVEEIRQENRDEIRGKLLGSTLKKNSGAMHEFLSLPRESKKKVEKWLLQSDKENRVMRPDELTGLNTEEKSAYYAWKTAMDAALELRMQWLEKMNMLPYQEKPWYGHLENAIAQKGKKNRDKAMNDAMANIPQNETRAFAEAYKAVVFGRTEIARLRRDIGRIKFYVPHQREGEYVVDVYDPNVEQPEDWTPARGTWKGRLIWSERSENKVRGAETLMRLRQKFPKMTVTDYVSKQTPEEIYQAINEASIEKFIEGALKQAQKQEGVSPEAAHALRDALFQTVTDDLRARGWERHAIKRGETWVGGYQTDNLDKSFVDYMSGLSGSLTKMEAAYHYAQALKNIDPKKKELYAYAQNYVKNLTRNQTSLDRKVGKAKAVAFTWYITGKLSMVPVQLTQNFVTGIPQLGRYTQNPARKYMKAMADVATQAKVSSLPDEEQAALKEFHDKGLDHAKFMEDVMGQTEGYVSGAWNTVGRVLGTPFFAMENFNRKSAFLAAYRAFRGKGKPGEEFDAQAFKKARDFVYDTHFQMGRANKPELAAGATPGSAAINLAYTFSSFSHNFALSIVDGFRTGNAREGGLTLLRSLAWLSVFGGLTAIPFLDDLLDELEKLFGVPARANMRKTLRAAGGETLEKLGMHGVPALLGYDLSGSLKTSIPFKEGVSETATGVYGGLWEKLSRGTKSFYRGDHLRALEQWSPLFAENAMKGWRMYNEPATTPSGRIIYDDQNQPMKLTGKEALGQGMGIRPTKVSMAQGKKKEMGNIVRFYADRKESIYDEYALAKTSEDRIKVMKKVRVFNQEAGKLKGLVSLITMDTLRQSIRRKVRPDSKMMKYERATE